MFFHQTALTINVRAIFISHMFIRLSEIKLYPDQFVILPNAYFDIRKSQDEVRTSQKKSYKYGF